ncbi:transcriptional activator myb-like isoform x1 [Anaeramoeba flamelloides]|uniref:Transcriptional activator myb-like isoform x1 n=1 Tax=Anaeramoeba flamelloides TaxID=1746091 RepID=A0ABQ8YUZ8_9EUKA|nr:transcriptional activator myb-like isoform x1 [Anaeramoeba flamelloides]
MNPIKVNNSFNIKPTLSNDSHESITSFQCNNQNLTTSYHCVRNQRSNFGTDNGKRKGTWEKYEDNQLIEAVKTIETHSWTKIANLVPSRTAKQCRERWINQLNPDLVHGNWTNEEDDIILKMRGQLGNKWAQIQKKLSRRSANAIKNRYNSLATLTKKKRRNKQQPQKHKIQKKNKQGKQQKIPYIKDSETNNSLKITMNTTQLKQANNGFMKNQNNSQLLNCPSPKFTECFRSPQRRKRTKKKIDQEPGLKSQRLFQNEKDIKKNQKSGYLDFQEKSNLEILLLVAEQYF